jgi:hypothetical protein
MTDNEIDSALWNSRMAEADRAAPPTFADEVNTEANRLRVRDAARDAYALEKAAANPAPPFDAGTLEEILARPPRPPARIEELLPWEAAMLLVAQRKCGKTTTELNLARSLLTGEDFLGKFGVRKIDGCVGFLNYEVSADQIGKWADEHHIDRKRLFLVNLRGRRNPLSHPDDRARLTNMLRDHDTEALFVDPFGRAYSGISQNDPGEVTSWLTELDRFARTDVAALDIIMSAHAGWDGERTRGASALDDWADSIVTLVRGKDDDEKTRYLRATGRDVEIEEDKLDYDHDTRTLTLSGSGSRRKATADQKVSVLVPEVVAIVRREPGLNGSEIEVALRDKGVSFQKGVERLALKSAVQLGWIRAEPRGRAKHYFETPNSYLGSRDLEPIPPETFPRVPPQEELPYSGRSPASPRVSPTIPPSISPTPPLYRGDGDIEAMQKNDRDDYESLGESLREQHLTEDQKRTEEEGG